MPKVRLDLSLETFEALTQRAAQERRPIDWQAEVLIESGLGIRQRRHDTRSDTRLASALPRVAAKEAIRDVA